LYLYNTSLLMSLLLGTAFKQTLVPGLSKPFILGAIACNALAVATYYVHFYRNRRARVHAGLEQMIEALRKLPHGVVMCIPANWYDVIAYKTGQPVLWGGHGYGFRHLEPTFPRFLIPIGEIVTRYQVRYLLTMDGMLTPAAQSELPGSPRVSYGEYHLYCFDRDVASRPVEWDGTNASLNHALKPA
jgi:hypothetical protein